MAGGRSYASRPRPRTLRRPRPLQADDPSLTARQLLDHLSSSSSLCEDCGLRPLQHALLQLASEPTADVQRNAGCQLLSTMDGVMDAALRQRVAHVAESLSAWQQQEPNAAISLSTKLLTHTLHSKHPRDGAACRAALRAIISLATQAARDSTSCEALAHHIPTLIPLLHAVVFQATGSRGRTDESSVTSALSDESRVRDGVHASGSVASFPSRPMSARQLALAALQAMVVASSATALPFWPQLLPTRAGVARATAPARQTVATLLLYDTDVSVRHTAASLASALVTSARPFVQRRVRAPMTVSGPTFVPASERVLAACAAMVSVTASALRTERSPLVIPKLTRLAADLAHTAPPPAVPCQAFFALLAALRTTACTGTNKTARSAAASALSTALSAGADAVRNDSFLPLLRDDVVDALVATSDGTRPEEELLGILRVIVTLDARLFPSAWARLSNFCIHVVARGKGDDALLALHTVRVIEAFLNTMVQQADQGHRLDENVVAITCAVYREVLKMAVCHSFHAVQVTGIVSLDAILRLLPADSGNIGRAYACSGAEDAGLRVAPRDVLLETVDVLRTIVCSTSTYATNVRASATKALAALPIDAIDESSLKATLELLIAAARDCRANGDLSVRGRAFSSFADIIDCGLKRDHVLKKDIKMIVLDAAGLACNHLTEVNMTRMPDNSATMRANVESCRLAAIHIVATFLCVAYLDDKVVHSPGTTNILTNLTEKCHKIMCDIARNGDESVNTRCGCCKMMAHVLQSQPKANDHKITKTRQGMYDVLQGLVGTLKAARLEGTAAKAVTEVLLGTQDQLHLESTLLLRCGRSLAWGVREARSLEMSSKDRGQYVHLQNCVSELACTILNQEQNMDSFMADEKEDIANVVQGLIAGICQQHDVSKYLTLKLMSARNNSELEQVLSSEMLTESDLLSCKARLLFNKVFALVNGIDIVNERTR